jgi:probable rRNA maturation factor
VIEIVNQTDFTPPVEKISEIAKYLTQKEFEILICENEFIRELNFDYRQKDEPTDVLSFPLIGEMLGSMAISIDFVKSGSFELQHSEEDEFLLLFIHGLLHLIGYDHETDNGEMREKERETIEQFSLPKSLIIRNS